MLSHHPEFHTTIGIDLGTTNSCMSYPTSTTPQIIENSEGSRTTPSIVSYTPKGILVGEAARRRQSFYPKETITHAKRLIGIKYDQVTPFMRQGYTIIKGPNNDAWVEVNGVKYSPSQISAEVLKKMKKDAEKKLCQPVDSAVITCPAYFNDAQRQATKDAGRIAGLNVKRIINEPTAAALAYGIDATKANEGRTVAVFDLGGGTFDVSILEIRKGVFQVKSTNGDTALGGADFDGVIASLISNEFYKVNKEKILTQRGRVRVREEAERVKCELSSSLESSIVLPYLEKGKSLEMTLTRKSVEEKCHDLTRRLKRPCEQAIKDSRLTKQQINDIVLVGGMTRMPLIQQTVFEIFGKYGNGKVNADEAVAIGAGMQAGVLEGKKRDIVLVDVTPLTLGIETMGGVMTPLIERNTTIPTRVSREFTTTNDFQREVDVKIYQGERKLAKNNKKLGEMKLVGIPPAKRGVAKIEVTFDINADGIVKVSAKDLGTGKESGIQIKSDGGLSEEEIAKIIKEGNLHKEEDEKVEQLLTLKNKVKGEVEAAQEIISNLRKKNIPFITLSKAITKINGEVTGNNIESIKKAEDQLIEEMSKSSEKLYK
ncbi:heat shock 70 kDa protein, putative [Entamoeba invadens IP1]|uniref:Heat shock 70 kDa protein, putative n=1 Tax=Entamoeba invadens IP1 TaxID=370355 RepID=A0A0A1U1N8_ENTIV|nr:heat shock 70 kDa protein, putative [Entamoeba invadens IP1]ELP87927.1 heat shock 70 kDa protein, putative [Entamoeba invadens IP1]|eukprot:XP_004254698.1 heat shock 70 kDa protein, putative [Entamoeba invadens IP1]